MTRFLIDTHVFVWLLGRPGELRVEAREALSHPSNEVCLSIASIWEANIKMGTRRRTIFDETIDLSADEILEVLARSGIKLLPVDLHHAVMTRRLPLHHGDPFDRMMIVQALEGKLVMVTRDSKFLLYDDLTILAA